MPKFPQIMCVKYYELRCMFYKKKLLVKVGAFAWYSVKIRAIFGVRFEREKVGKKTSLHKNWNMQTLFQSLLNISAKFHQNRSLQFGAIPFQNWRVFLRHSVLIDYNLLFSSHNRFPKIMETCRTKIALIRTPL